MLARSFFYRNRDPDGTFRLVTDLVFDLPADRMLFIDYKPGLASAH